GACPLVDTCSTGGGGTGGSTGFTCDSCINQAWGACQQPYDACLNNTQCNGLLTCFESCGNDDACANACFDKFPQAYDPYVNLVYCLVCGQCTNVCSAEWGDFCNQPPPPGGLLRDRRKIEPAP